MNRAPLVLLQRFARKRPYTFTALVAGSGLTAAAVATEWRADRLERQQVLLDGSSSSGLPRDFDAAAIHRYWSQRPVTVVRRLFQISHQLIPLAARYWMETSWYRGSNEEDDTFWSDLQRQHAISLRNALTALGPAFVKAGQQLSIRPDLVPAVVLKELQQLCDAVPPCPDAVAFQVLLEEWNVDSLDEVVIDGELQLVASASLGQVYKGRLQKNEADVAIKVQRPHMRRNFSLDLFFLQKFGGLVDAFTSLFTNQPPFHQALYESFARGSYAELDYEQEGQNQVRFQKELAQRQCPVVVPSVDLDWTTERVLTAQWIDGIKLAEAPRQTIQALIPVGVELFLTQLLDMGFFHADPHPGNLLVTPQGQLCLLDFGLCTRVDLESRQAMTKAMFHLLTRDFESLVAKDAKELGFLPHDFDTRELQPLLTKILTVGVLDKNNSGGSSADLLQRRQRKFLEISNELNQVFFQYPFTVPPFFALVTRGLGLLEGIALSGDPDFDIFRASAPFARRRAAALLGFRKTMGSRGTTMN